MLIYLIAGGLLVVVLAAIFYRDPILSMLQRIRGGGPSLDSVLAILPEVELNLESSSPSEWADRDELQKDEVKLEKQGLIHQGYFAHRANSSFVELSLWKYKQAVTIAIINTIPESEEDAATEYSLCAFVKLDNGGTLCISNSDNADILPRNPKHKLVVTKTQDVFQLMKMLKDNTPAGNKIIPTSDSKTLFTSIFEEVSEWIWQEKQLISSQFEEACEAHDINLTDNDLDALINLGHSKLSKIYSARILNRLEKSRHITTEKWHNMRERLVVIHEKMGAEDISDVLYRLVTNLSEDQEVMIEEFSSSGQLSDPIASFSELMESLNSDAKRIASMTSPIAGEVYLAN